MIKVIRGSGDKEKIESLIQSPLSNLEAALQLGRVVLDEGENYLPVTQRILFNGELRVGDIIECYDRLQLLPWRGVVTGIQHGYNSGNLITELTALRKPV